MKRRLVVLAALGVSGIFGVAAYGCSEDETPKPPASNTPTDSGNPQDQNVPPMDSGGDGPVYTARVDIRSTADAAVLMGTGTFTEQNNQVTAVVNMTAGFPPGALGLRGMHIHNGNNCNPTDAGAGTVTPGGGAGPHWNPGDAGHGYPGAGPHHVGDMGNIMITDAGTGTLTLTSTEWRVQAGANSVVGHAIIFHAQHDDGMTQPTGDAGARPGCGVIVNQ